MNTPQRPVFDPKARMAVKAVTQTYQAEETIEKAIVAYLDGLAGACQFKYGKNGWPDRVLCYKGFFVGIEVKSSNPSQQLTVRQKQRIMRIRAAGGIGIMAKSVNDVVEVIRRIDDTVERAQTYTSTQRRPKADTPAPDVDRKRAIKPPVRRQPRKTPASRKPLDGQLRMV